MLASNNAKKLSELQSLLVGLPLVIVAQGTLGIVEAEEPHHSFIENALAKARHAARASGSAAVADDSGLCLGSLGGAPGVISAHFAGHIEPLDGEDREALRRRQDAANNAALLAKLQGVADRRGHFISTLVAIRHADDPEPLVAVGRWPGEILHQARGEQTKVTRGREVTGFGQAFRVFIHGGFHAQLACLLVHQLDKPLQAAANTLSQGHGGIVATLDDHAFDQVLNRHLHLWVDEHA